MLSYTAHTPSLALLRNCNDTIIIPWLEVVIVLVEPPWIATPSSLQRNMGLELMQLHQQASLATCLNLLTGQLWRETLEGKHSMRKLLLSRVLQPGKGSVPEQNLLHLSPDSLIAHLAAVWQHLQKQSIGSICLLSEIRGNLKIQSSGVVRRGLLCLTSATTAGFNSTEGFWWRRSALQRRSDYLQWLYLTFRLQLQLVCCKTRSALYWLWSLVHRGEILVKLMSLASLRERLIWVGPLRATWEHWGDDKSQKTEIDWEGHWHALVAKSRLRLQL